MRKITILDGGMGTMLQAAGMKPGEHPEIYGLAHPDVVRGIHDAFIKAGSEVIYANTFGANRRKLAGTGHSVAEVVRANVISARASAAGHGARVALDIGPIGELLEPLGTLSFEEAYDIFKEMVEAGVDAGVSLIVIETMTDLAEARAAVLAAKECSGLPVWVTMSFEATGRTFTGTTVPAMALALGGLGVEAIGINCSLGPEQLVPLVTELHEWTELPIIVKPNAGLPDPATGEYSLSAVEFGKQMRAFPRLGGLILGGCCGTTPRFIERIAGMRERAWHVKKVDKRHGVCSAMRTVEFSGRQEMEMLNRPAAVHVIGERINPTGKKRLQQALIDGDMNYIMQQAIEQEEAGAEILDINVGFPGIDEPAMMTQVVKAVQSVVSLPLQIDSSNPEAIEAGLRVCNGRAIVNSVNGKQAVLDTVLPIVVKYGAAVIALTLDEDGIPQSAVRRCAIAKRIISVAHGYDLDDDDILFDCLTMAISADQGSAAETLTAVRAMSKGGGLHTVLGVSNISFGLPERNRITENFLIQALGQGLEFAIVNPNRKPIMDAICTYRAICGEDAGCSAYIERFGQDAQGTAPAQATGNAAIACPEPDMRTAVLRGLREEVTGITTELLETMSELDVINEELIPALDAVGEQYEQGRVYLPQLINAANAACAGFDIVKSRIAARGGADISKGRVVLATVEGDIHDIGKNIVRVVLENYGYTVIDLGRDVPVQTVVDAVIREDAPVVGLSALMTTTVTAMQRTIEAIRESGHACRIIVGGAVLTADYAREIGADYYAKDAKQTADIVRSVLG